MKINIIYTFDNTPQQFETKEFYPILLEDKRQFFKYVTASLDEQEKKTLVKISTCVLTESEPLVENDRNYWWTVQLGKFYDDEIPQLMMEIYGVEIEYEPTNK